MKQVFTKQMEPQMSQRRCCPACWQPREQGLSHGHCIGGAMTVEPLEVMSCCSRVTSSSVDAIHAKDMYDACKIPSVVV